MAARQHAREQKWRPRILWKSSLPAVTIFKPVHGMEARLEENLESFFRQDYPSFEIILGARESDDPGLQLAEKVRQRYPQVKSRIVDVWPADLAQCQSVLAEQNDSALGERLLRDQRQ